MKKIIFSILGVLIVVGVVFLVVGCSKESSLNPIITGNDYVESTDYPKLMTNLYGQVQMAEAENGFYYVGDGLYLYYYEKKTGNVTVVCNKPNCDHTDEETCNGAINAFEIQYYEDKIYFVKHINGGRYLYSIDSDGENVKKVGLLEDNYNYSNADNSSFIIHRGIVYYVISTGEIMANKLGADSSNAKVVFGVDLEEIEYSNGYQIISDNVARRILYADGNNIYLRMLKKENNKYVETFYRYNAVSGKSEQVFQIPSSSEVGTWDETGVKSEGWYISGNTIYYFLSGNGLWKYDMETKENTKVIDLPESYGYGTIDDNYLYVNNGDNIDADDEEDRITNKQAKNLSIKVYSIETGEFVGQINYSDIWDDGNFIDFKIAGLTSSGILLSAYNEWDIPSYYYADRTDLENAKFQYMDFGREIQNEGETITTNW